MHAIDAASQIDRVSAWREDEARLIALRDDPAARWLPFRDGDVLVAAQAPDQLLWLQRDQLPESLSEDFLLGLHQDQPLFACDCPADAAWVMEAQLATADARRLLGRLSALDLEGLLQARGLLQWHRRVRHCGLCGQRTELRSSGWRAVCGGCGAQHFPRLDPAIIVAVLHGSSILLGRQASWPARRWSVLAGFVEPGESLEQALRREVREESGVEVGTIDYIASQAWPFPASLMLGFVAQACAPELLRGDELEQVEWFTPSELASAVRSGEMLLPLRGALSSLLVEWWWQRHGDGGALPVGPRTSRA